MAANNSYRLLTEAEPDCDATPDSNHVDFDEIKLVAGDHTHSPVNCDDVFTKTSDGEQYHVECRPSLCGKFR